MKKLNYLFTLLLLLIGVGGAQAQWSSPGEAYTEVPEAGSRVYLYSATESKYYCGAAKAVDQANDNCVMLLEQDGTTDDGLPVFVIKQVSTGLYVKDKVVSLNDGEDTQDAHLVPADFATSNKAEAYHVTLVKAIHHDYGAYTDDDPTPNPNYTQAELRSWTTVEGTNLFVTANKDLHPGGEWQKQYYFGVYGGDPFMSPYHNTNAWIIYQVDGALPYEVLGTSLDQMFPNGVTPDAYPVGEEPGEYGQQAYDAALSVYNEVREAINSIGLELTKEQVEAYIAKLQTASAALAASMKPMKPGYYFIQGHGRGGAAEINNWTYPLYVDKNSRDANGNAELKWAVEGNVTFPETLTQDHAQYIFQVEAVDDTLFTLKSFSEGRYVGVVKTDGEGGNTYLADVPGKYGIVMHTFDDNGAKCSAFCIALNGNVSDIHCMHQAGGGRVVGWYSNALADAFRFVTISEEKLAEMRVAIEQEQRNKALNEAVANASELYNRGRIYKATEAYNEEDGYYLFEDMGLAGDPGQLSSNSEATNEGDKGGPVRFVVDSQGDTYYHSVWNGATVTPEITFNLGEEPYQELVFQFARRNAAKNHLSQFQLFASNDNENWTDEGIYAVNYDKDGLLSGWQANSDTIRKAVAVTGFTLSQPARYLRLVVTGTTNSEYSNGFLMAHFAEIRVYKGEFDAEASTSFFSVDEAVRNELLAAIDAAKAALNAGTATQELITRLNNAIQAFQAQYPVPSLATDAKADLVAYLNHLPFVDDAAMQIGNFPQTAKTEVLAQAEAICAAVDVTSATSINAAVEQIAALKASVAAKIKMPEVGKLYLIRGATTATAANSGKGAPIYAQGNDLEKFVRFMPRKSSSTDEVVVDSLDNMAHYYNFIWQVEAADQAAQTLVLRNVGTGMYLKNNMDKNSAGLTVVANPTAVKMGSFMDNASNAVSLEIGKLEDGRALYMNTTPGGNVVAYFIAGSYTSDPDANSSLKFEEVSALSGNDEDNYTNWPVGANYLQIVTLPYAGEVMTMNEGEALYTVDGVNGTDNTVELSEVASGSLEVEAGEAFVIKTAPGQNFVMVVFGDKEVPAYSFTGLKKNGLQGNVLNMVGSADGRGLTLYSNGVSWFGRTVTSETKMGGNGGYFYDMEMTNTKGDLSVVIQDPQYATGITDIESAANAKNGKIYDLSGRRVSNAQKGLYIINGKKVLVK